MPTQSSFSNKFEPPDPYLQELAAKINKVSRQGRVSFFCQNEEHSAIFQNGSRRAVVRLYGKPTEADIDSIVQAIESWAGFKLNGSAYSVEVPPLPVSEWP